VFGSEVRGRERQAQGEVGNGGGMFLKDFSQETAEFLVVSESLDFRITSEPGVEVSRQFYSSAQETYFSKADQYSWREELSYMYRRDKMH
jgi:hypothetical protein